MLRLVSINLSKLIIVSPKVIIVHVILGIYRILKPYIMVNHFMSHCLQKFVFGALYSNDTTIASRRARLQCVSTPCVCASCEARATRTSSARACVSCAHVRPTLFGRRLRRPRGDRSRILLLPARIPCATSDLLLKYLDAILATYKRRQMKH